MKKGEIVLTIIANLAVVGGALAFRAHKTSIVQFYACNAAKTSCELIVTRGEKLTVLTPQNPALYVTVPNAIDIIFTNQGNCAQQGCTINVFYSTLGVPSFQ